MNTRRPLAAAMSLLGVAWLHGCGVPIDSAPQTIDPPVFVFPQGVDFDPDIEADLPDRSMHPLYFLRNDKLVQIDGAFDRPVPLRDPLDRLLLGPSADDAANGLETRIPPGTEVLDVSQRNDLVVVINLNDAFYEIEGNALRQATAQLVFTGYDLVRDAQGVQFLRNGVPQALPRGDGTIAQSTDGSATPLRTVDFSDLIPQPSTRNNPGTGFY